MAAQISAHNGVSEAVVRNWEDEFELIKPIVTRVDTGKTEAKQKQDPCYNINSR